MDSKVFERAMFKAESKPRKADSGIMQGFDDEEPKDIEENDDDMMEEVSRRSPSSPEILMNNLRGDMRSVDARYQELAEMVGEDVAMETPPEILAMLQSQFMAQQLVVYLLVVRLWPHLLPHRRVVCLLLLHKCRKDQCPWTKGQHHKDLLMVAW